MSETVWNIFSEVKLYFNLYTFCGGLPHPHNVKRSTVDWLSVSMEELDNKSIPGYFLSESIFDEDVLSSGVSREIICPSIGCQSGPRQVNRGLRLSPERGRMLRGLTRNVDPRHDMSGSVSDAFLCRKVQSGIVNTQCCGVMWECLSDRITLSQLETWGQKKCPLLNFLFLQFCLLLPHLHHKGQDYAVCTWQ